LTTSITTTEPDQIASLHLIADSIAQQRQLAARSMLTHPAVLSCLTFSLFITYFFTRALSTTGEDNWPYLLLITWPACIMVYLLAAAHTTHPYLEKAGRTGTWVWLWKGGTRDHHGAEDNEEEEEEDIMLVTKYHNRVIGTLVLRIIRTEEELWGHVRDAPVGVIRAWTVEQHLRGVGVGRNLLENAIRICRQRGIKGPVFSDCHANEVLGLPVVCNGELVRRERRAREVLEGVKREVVYVVHTGYLPNKSTKKKMSTTTATATTSAASCTSTGNLYVLPVQDAACAIPNTKNASAIMDKCCSPASPTKYDNDCGIYCLAQGQDVKELLSCIQSNGAVEDPFCSGNLTATATASVTGTKATGSTKTGTSTGSAASETGSSAAVPMKQAGVSKVGLGMLGMVLC
ncbi:hypothetical protein ASPNIDRAFT_123645, partial [Aspergillus niger ATCC 1015]